MPHVLTVAELLDDFAGVLNHVAEGHAMPMGLYWMKTKPGAARIVIRIDPVDDAGGEIKMATAFFATGSKDMAGLVEQLKRSS